MLMDGTTYNMCRMGHAAGTLILNIVTDCPNTEAEYGVINTTLDTQYVMDMPILNSVDTTPTV